MNVERVSGTGSLDDLLVRLGTFDRSTPRQLSMQHLAYGNAGSASLRTDTKVFPQPHFARFDAGPNVVVICSEGSTTDLALLWNLRGALGDARTLPVGIPASQATREAINQLTTLPDLSRNGSPVKSLYVTSTTLSVSEIGSRLGRTSDRVGIVPWQAMLDFGYAGGWTRDEVLNWHNGTTRFVPLPRENHRVVAEQHLSDTATMRTTFEVPEDPFPRRADLRISVLTSQFYAGSLSSWGTTSHRTKVRQIEWPSRLLRAKAVAARRGLALHESEPGRAARIVLEGLGDLGFLHNLLHAPLLAMLESMAARQGFGWYKDRLRTRGVAADPLEAVGRTVDDLPEKSFSDFKRVLGNNEKAARFWLSWAEESKLMVKGFPISCHRCHGKQWIPVSGFAPPVICRGCAEEITSPFGDRPIVEFKYRLSERLRRVYEQDAMGHLLAARYFDSLLGIGNTKALIGLHPGMEIRKKGEAAPDGEADVLLLTADGEFVPMEVKRTATGFTPGELEKLERLQKSLASPWTAIATCQYASEAGEAFPQLTSRHPDSTYSRIALSYDALLEPNVHWGLGEDVLAWAPLSADQIKERERDFVRSLAGQHADPAQGHASLLESRMLHVPTEIPL